jgi:hypothetical protein
MNLPHIPVTIVARPVVSKLIALQSFFFGRPMIDIDIILDPEKMYGQSSKGVSAQNSRTHATNISDAKYDMEYHWHYKLRIKNNSTKTAYNVRVEKFYKGTNDYLQKIDAVASIESNQVLTLDYIIRHEATATGAESNKMLKPFPGFIEKIEVIVSYTNEGRTRYYTQFIMTPTTKTNEYLFLKPKNI